MDAIVDEFKDRGMDEDHGLLFRECKEPGDCRTQNDRGNFTMEDLREKAREFLGLGDE